MDKWRILAAAAGAAVTLAVGVGGSILTGLEPRVWVPAAFTVPIVVAVVILPLLSAWTAVEDMDFLTDNFLNGSNGVSR